MSQEQVPRPESQEEQVQPESREEVQQEEKVPMEEQEQSTVQAEEQEHSSLQTEKQEHSPLTYGDVFPATLAQGGSLSGEAITTEDASLMQTAEAMAFGKTQKGGAASMMQSAAAKNVKDGTVERDAHSKVAEEGLSVSETSVPGATMDIEFVAGHPVSVTARPTPTDPEIAAQEAVTIGEALEAAAVGAGDRPIDQNDARAISSAERRATGVSTPMKGGIGATAQSAAQHNIGADADGQTTLSDVLMDATLDLPSDKVVTYEDAFKVLQAELRGRNVEELQPGGVGAMLVAAADLNEQAGLIQQPAGYSNDENKAQQEAVGQIHDDYQPIDSSPALPKENSETMEEEKLTKDAVAQLHGGYEPLTSTPASEENQEKYEVLPKESEEKYEAPLARLSSEEPSATEGKFASDIPAESPKQTEETTPLVSKDSEQLPSHGSEELPAPKPTEVC